MNESLFGWVPPQERSSEQHEAHEAALATMPAFSLAGTYRSVTGRFPLWQAGVKLFGRHVRFNWQLTGSCVGAGGENMLKVLSCVEIVAGQPEEFQELWWPYTYGQSRARAGMRGQGEGSLGSSWAEAIQQDGIFSRSEAPELPAFTIKGGDAWVQLTERIEMQWSDGNATKGKYGPLGLKHPVKTVSPIRSSDEAKAALANGYPLTLASTFGTRGARIQGSPGVPLAEWDDRWPHQMSCNEVWDHPSLGMIFHIQNNWGPEAAGTSPPPTQGEPTGGFYVTASTFDRICAGQEVFAFSAFDGFPVRELDFYI